MSEGQPNLRAEPILLDLPDQLPGDRVLVRRYRPGDGAAVWEAIEESRERLRPWMPWTEFHRSVDDSEAFVRRSDANWALRTDFVAGIWDNAGGAYLGSSGLHPIDWEVPFFEIGYWLRTSAEGKGYVSETVRLLCALAFGTLRANRVFLRCDTRNDRSAAVARRLGFTLEATHRRDSRDTSGVLRDTWCFSLLPEEYARGEPEQSISRE